MTASGGNMLIAQISDLHVMLPGKHAFDTIDTAAHLSRCIKHIVKLQPRPAAVIASGDLVDEGSETEYRRLRELLAPLTMPVYLMPGNHDRRGPLRAIFTDHDYFAPTGTMNYMLEFGAPGSFLVLALDTVVEGEPHGALDDAQLAWLAARLSSAPHQPTLILMHHPPVATGMVLMDGIGLEPASTLALKNIVSRHRQIARIGCGHVHRAIEVNWAGTQVSICPSTAFQSALAFDGSAWRPAMNEPPGYQLHHWNGRELATHVIAVQSQS